MAQVKAIQPDNEIFCSVYRKDFVFWRDHDHRKTYAHDDYYRLTSEMAEKFLQIETKPDFSKMEQYLEDMKELDRLRLQTLYGKEYCLKSSYKISRDVDPEKFSPKNDKFLIDGAVRFGVPAGKVMPPLPSARRVLAYSPYDDYRTPLSTYQDLHGRVGYERVKQAADGGYWRMGPRYDHKKELADIKNILRRESDINEREKEEKLIEEEMMKKQIEKDREEMIKKSLKKRSLKRGTEISQRFGPDPRKTLARNSIIESSVQSSAAKEDGRHNTPRERTCTHTQAQHNACERKLMILLMDKACHQCDHTEEDHVDCKKQLVKVKE